MARKKRTKKSSQRRRRVSGVALNAKNPIVAFGPMVAGYFLGDKINEALSNVTGTLDPKIVAAAEVAGGIILKKYMKGLPGAIGGGLLIGAGAKKGLQAFGVISGLPVVNGYRDLKTINGLPAPRRINGPVAPGLSRSTSVISGVDSLSGYMDNDYR
jgi:hypothetical protein